MALIDNKGQLVEDRWLRADDTATLADGTPVIVSLARLRAEAESLRYRNAAVGVWLPSGTPLAEIAEFLPWLGLVALEIPKFRDGRAYTTARELRERYAFAGEVRAFGHILPDQYVFLLRLGVTSVELPAGTKIERWTAALDEFDIAYQPAIVGDAPLSVLRRRLALN